MGVKPGVTLGNCATPLVAVLSAAAFFSACATSATARTGVMPHGAGVLAGTGGGGASSRFS